MRGKWREVLCQAGPFVHPRRAAAAMMLLTAASRFGLHYLVSWNSSLLWVEPINVGRALATGNGFANAFGPASGPTAHCSPAYPVLVSLIFRCFGPDSTAAANGVRLLGLLLAGITCGGLVLYSNYCHLNRWVTLGAAFFIALVPMNYFNELFFETTLAALAVVAVLLGFRWLNERAVHRGGMINYRDAAIAGLICGAAGLVSPLLLTMSAALAIQMVYRHGRMILPPMLVSAAIAAMVLLPWAARNRIVLGKWIWTRSNLGLELLVSNQNDSSPLLGGNIGPGRIHSREHPFLNQDRYQYIIAVGEVAFQQEQGDRAWAWIRSHPKEFGRLCVARFLLFWLPVINAATLTRQSVALSAVMLLGLLGLTLALCDKVSWAQEAAVVLLVYPLPYYVIEVSSRYRYPIDTILILLASYAIFRTVVCRSRGSEQHLQR